MGVPKFYRWISERYPCLSEVVKEYQIPEFDNLYLDMNGIVHICSHPEDNNPHFRITEEKIFADIFHYIEVLFRLVKPNKVFFMAIDGVAPRAKMNQQRGRRFRSAKEAEDLIRQALEKGEILPKEQRFDSNCITPGTPFMVRLQEQLKYFVNKKVTTDRMWQGPRIYLSGHETPGEGEHKVMDFIRYEKSKPDYDCNTRHCLYGLDADLIMLGLTSHEPHFSLLREEVRFGKKDQQKRSNTPEETTFHLLHLSLMREYLDFEFSPMKKKLPFEYNIENIIDDWVLMGFLIGNDFIPHLPHVHIHQEALPLLWRTYMQVLPTLDGYLNEGGYLNLPRFEKYMRVLSKHDVESFSDNYADLKWLESKMGGRTVNESLEKDKKHKLKMKQLEKFQGIPTANEFMTLMEVNDDDFHEGENDLDSIGKELGALSLEQTGEIEEEEEEEEWDEEEMFEQEFRKHKDNYYLEKMNLRVTPEVLREQCHGYVRAIQWILHYYYNGVPSWSWYFEHHYAPHISDIRDFSHLNIKFDMSHPFLPFQQLMAVLPSASKNLLPKCLQDLMLNETSPVIDFYPQKFESDMNGKMQEWEAVVLIPFIDERRLIGAMDAVIDNMDDAEKARNCHSGHLLYEYVTDNLGTYESPLPDAFPNIPNNHCRLTKVGMFEFQVEPAKLRKGLLEGTKQDVYFPGFPTLKHIPHTAELKKEGVKVFQMNSRGENMMLGIKHRMPPDLEQLAHDILGKSVYVGWPHLFEARVMAVCDGENKYHLVEENRRHSRSSSSSPAEGHIQSADLTQDQFVEWRRDIKQLTETYHDRKGVEAGETDVVLYACPMSGRKYVCGSRGNITLEKQWFENPLPYLYQASVKDIAVMDPTFSQFKTLDELFPVKSEVFMLGSPHYGSMGEVLNIDPKNDGRIRVDFTIHQEPELDQTMRREQSLSVKYMPGYVVAQRLGVTSFLVSRITGTIFVNKGGKDNPGGNKMNIGLNLKFNKKNEEVPGYTKKTENGSWLYSDRTQRDLGDYIQKFPDLFDYISANTKEDNYFEEDVFPENTGERMQDLAKFLKEIPCSGAPRMPVGSEFLEDIVVKEIEKEVDKIKEVNRKKKKRIKMQVRPHLLYRPLEAQATLVPDSSAMYELYDRIVNIRDGFSVPLGLRGTIIGINPAEKSQDIMYDVVFDDPFAGGLTLRCSPSRGYRMPNYSIINLSHGERKEYAKTGHNRKPTAVVKPQQPQYSQGQAESYSALANKAQGYQRGYQRFQSGGHLNPKDDHQNTHQDRHGNKQDRHGYQHDRQGYQQDRQAHPQGRQGHHQNRQGYQDRQGQQEGRDGYRSGNQGNQSGGYQRAGRRQDNRNHNGRQHQKEDDEFANIWQQLQKGVKFEAPPTSHSQNENQNCNKSSQGETVMQKAAQALPGNKDKQKESFLGNQGLVQSDSSMQKIDIDTLFGSQSAQENKDMAAVGNTTAQESSNEFLKLMKSLEHSGVPQETVAASTASESEAQDGTAALVQMLKIGQPTDTSTQQEQQQKSYGKQVSVQELFQGAKPGVAPSAPQQKTLQKPRHQPHSRQQQTSKRTRVMELLQYCQAMGIPPPRYDFNVVGEKKVSAVVTLANGLRFQGSQARTQDQASDSAASAALLNLQGPSSQPPFSMAPPGGSNPRSAPGGTPHHHQGEPQLQGPPPRGGFSSSPNSAFTPVRPANKQNDNYNQNSNYHHQMAQAGPHSYGHHQPFPNPPVRQGPPPQQAFLHTRGQHWQGQGYRGPQGQQQRGYQGQQRGYQDVASGPGYQGQAYQGQAYQGHDPRGHHSHFKNQGYQDFSQGQNQEGCKEQRTPRDNRKNRTHRDSSSEEKDLNKSLNEDDAPKTPAKNPFVPLQVMRQQKTPQREVPSKTEIAMETIGENHLPNTDNKAQVMTTPPRHAATPSTKVTPKHAGQGHNSAKGGKGQPRRPKSRIAANFGAKD